MRQEKRDDREDAGRPLAPGSSWWRGAGTLPLAGQSAFATNPPASSLGESPRGGPEQQDTWRESGRGASSGPRDLTVS